MVTADLPLRIINATAPIRVCDNGGWTDTWFAGYGRVFNIAVTPRVEVQIAVFPRSARDEQIMLNVENYGERYVVMLGKPEFARHPLLEATLEEMPLPDDVAIEIAIHSDVPAGASTGTSAAVTVALVGALDALTPGRLTPHEAAYRAHRVETHRLGLQSGIQDQLCSAYGGINYIEMHTFPHATVSQIKPSTTTRWELERRLMLVFLGKTHSSSAIHQQVIAGLEHAGSGATPLALLRDSALHSRDALYDGDFVRLGKAMQENTEAQALLHPALISPEAHALIDLAREYGALGWKVNGAGGDGGSVTLLCGVSAETQRSLMRAIPQCNPLFQVIPITLDGEGLRVWESQPDRDR